MKKFFLHLFIFISIYNFSYGQLTLSSVEGISPSRSLTYTNPITNSSETRTVGLCYGKIGNPQTGADACYYSYDIIKAPATCLPNYDYVDDSTTEALPKVIYIVYNYYPGKNPGAGQLSNLNNETAAIQAAIWHFTNGLDLNSITSTTVKNRAIAIAAAADANGGSSTVLTTMRIIEDADPTFFVVETKDDNGNGMAVNNIALSISAGSLSLYSVNTSASGFSPAVEVIGTSNGTITALAPDITIPKGRLFRNITNSCPKLILACNGPGTLKVQTDWGALPVELTSFTSTLNGRDVTLNWTTASELNNKGFDIEKSIITGDWKKIGFISGRGNSSVQNDYSFSDRINESGRYNYRLKQIDYNGNFEYFNLSNFVSVGIPASFTVSQNYPNPFNPSTKINYDLPFDGNISIKVFDMSGKEVLSFVNGIQSAGYYTATIDGSKLSSGVYFYRVNLDDNKKNFVITKKMLLIK